MGALEDRSHHRRYLGLEPCLDQIDLQVHTDRDGAAAATLPVDGVTTASLGLTRRGGSWELDTVSVRRMPIHKTDSRRPGSAGGHLIRAAEYPSRSPPIPVPDDGTSVSDEACAKIACEALRGGTNSDVAFLPRLPASSRVWPALRAAGRRPPRTPRPGRAALHSRQHPEAPPAQLAGLGTTSAAQICSKSPKIWAAGSIATDCTPSSRRIAPD